MKIFTKITFVLVLIAALSGCDLIEYLGLDQFGCTFVGNCEY